MVTVKGYSRFFRLVLLAALVLSPWVGQPVLAHADSVEKPLPDHTADASNGLLQFQSGGHVLGFASDRMVVSNGTYALRVEFVDANAVTPQAAESGTPANGAAPQLTQVTYPDLWDGITLAYDAANGLVRSTYTVAPGADPAAIRLRYAAPVAVEADGSLRIDYETGELSESAPVAWQEIGGQRVPVAVRFTLLRGGEVSFRLGRYDPRYPLIIDPTLVWHTFLGGSGFDWGAAIAMASGNIYVVGYSDTAWGSPLRAYTSDYDAFVAKLDSDGRLIWNVFLGGRYSDGSDGEDHGRAIAVDDSGNVYVAGYSSDIWIETSVRGYSGGDDAFVAKLDSNGSLIWHTFLGGSGDDTARVITVDGSSVYVVGTSSATWGSPARAYTADDDAFAAKLSSDGSLTWNTFLGGSGSDIGSGIAVAGNGSVYVVGTSNATWGSPVRAYTGGYDAFVVSLESDGSLIWHTFLGGSGDDFGLSIAVDGSGSMYAAGWSTVTWGSPVRAYTRSYDAFAAKLGSDGSLTWHTFLGGSNSDGGRAIAVDSSGSVYVMGWSRATWGSPVHPYIRADDAYVALLGNDGSLIWNTFLGGSGDDFGLSIAVDGSGSMYVGGWSAASWGSPVRLHGGGDRDAFVAKLAPLTLTKSVSPTLAVPGEAITYTMSVVNPGVITATSVMITDTLSANITEASYTSSGVALTQVAGSRYAWTAPDLAENEGGLITLTGTLVKPLAVGTFTNTVTLAVSGSIVTVGAPLTVQNVAPVADGGADQYVGADEIAVLDGSGSSDDNGDALNYAWMQTGGVPAVTLSDAWVQAPTFTTPDEPTVLTFTVAVTDSHGATDMDEVVVTVQETRARPGVVKTVSPAVARPGERITYTIAFSNTGGVVATNAVIFDALSSDIAKTSYTSSGVALTPVAGYRYTWTALDLGQNEGGVITITGVLTKPLAAGTFTNTATLAVSGASKTASVPLIVMNVAPTADAGTDRPVALGAVVTLRGSGSSDDNGDALTYTWAQTGGPTVTLSGATTATASFTAGLTTPTVYTFTLTVNDGEAEDTDRVVITVARYTCYLPLVLKQ